MRVPSSVALGAAVLLWCCAGAALGRTAAPVLSCEFPSGSTRYFPVYIGAGNPAAGSYAGHVRGGSYRPAMGVYVYNSTTATTPCLVISFVTLHQPNTGEGPTTNAIRSGAGLSRDDQWAVDVAAEDSALGGPLMTAQDVTHYDRIMALFDGWHDVCAVYQSNPWADDDAEAAADAEDTSYRPTGSAVVVTRCDNPIYAAALDAARAHRGQPPRSKSAATAKPASPLQAAAAEPPTRS